MADESRYLTFHSDALADGDPPFEVVSFRGFEWISRPFRYEIDLVSTNASVDIEAMLENGASLGIKQRAYGGSGTVTLKIHGVLSRFEQLEKTAHWAHYRAVLVPRLWRTSLQSQSQIHLNGTAKDIVKKELEDSGFTADDFKIDADARDYLKREYTVQYEESDLDFLQRICEHEGIYYYFLHEDDQEKILFGDSVDQYATIPGNADLPYRPTGVGAKEEGATESEGEWWGEGIVSSLVCRHEPVPAKALVRDYNWRTPTVPLKFDHPVAERAVFGMYYEYGAHFKEEKDGKEIAKVRAQEIACRRRVFQGTSDAKTLRAGHTFSLKGHYRGEFNQKYLVTELRVEGGQPLPSLEETPLRFRAEFEAIPAVEIFRPRRLTHKPKISGYFTAWVDAGASGEYAEIDEHGRYKVKVPFDLSERGDGAASRFIRMGSPYAGAGNGMHFPLRKGTEVCLFHTNGDPDRPVIATAVTNPDTQNVVTGGNQTQCMIATTGGNNITIEDQAGGQRIYIVSPHSGTFMSMGAPMA